MNTELYFKIGRVFTPHTPVSEQDLFSGRQPQIKSLLRAISSQGSHAIIFGERGVGKTSLGHIISKYLPDDDSLPYAVVSCDGVMNYSTLWLAILSGLFIDVPKQEVGFGGRVGSDRISLATYFGAEEKISVQEVRVALERLGTGIVIIDELDRLDSETKAALADTIKALSDYNVRVTLVLIGVGDSVAELINEHQSIERALVQIHMPRMTTEEINGVIGKGLDALNMTIDERVRKKIVSLSRGLPHYTHLLMFHAAQHAVEKDRINIVEDDFKYGLEQSVDEKQKSLKNSYDVAIQSTKKAYLFKPVLLACALTVCDAEGFFAPIDVQEPLEKILGKKFSLAAFISHIGSFCTNERGKILERIGVERKYRYRFRNPLMQSFVIMKAMRDGQESATPLDELVLGTSW